MARYYFVKSARKPIYECGKVVEHTPKTGKNVGKTTTKLDRTLPKDERDKILINVGESYYYWSFRFGGTYYSKIMPRPSQLTQSNFYSQYYGIQERIEDLNIDSFSDPEEFEAERDEIVSELENLKEECQSSLDNMPEHLQENSPSGEALNERISSLEEIILEIENIECGDYDEDDNLDEWIEDKLQELQNITFEL